MTAAEPTSRLTAAAIAAAEAQALADRALLAKLQSRATIRERLGPFARLRELAEERIGKVAELLGADERDERAVRHAVQARYQAILTFRHARRRGSRPSATKAPFHRAAARAANRRAERSRARNRR